jgi:putative ABC transport system permease protein
MRLYRLLLWLYPASIRAEYGREMCAVFDARMREATGPLAAAALWIEAVTDVVVNAIRAHGDILRQDLRVTLRSLGRTPGFAVAAIAVASLGIGATTAAFSLADHVLMRPLPFYEPDRLVRLWQDQSYRGYPRLEIAPGNYHDWERMNLTLERIAAFRGLSVNLVGAGLPQRIDGASVTAGLFPLLGAQASIGRVFSANDDREDAAGTVLLSTRLWRAQFGGDPAILGRQVMLDGRPFTVIGVMPADFNFPSRDALLWTPMQFAASQFDERDNYFLGAVGRLKPGVTVDQVRADLGRVAELLARAYPRENAQSGVTVVPLHDVVPRQSRVALVALAGASGCVLLIACSNLASLLLARALGRRRELAVRAALGAGRERLVRQLLTETGVLAVAGGVLGVGIALVATPLAAALAPDALPIAALPAVDGRLLAVAVLATLAAALGIGAGPALRAGRMGLDALTEGTRAGTGRRTERLRGVLVIVQVATSVILLVLSGLLLRALWLIERTDPGFRTPGVLTAQTSLPMPKYEAVAVRQRFYDRVLAEVRGQPGVMSAAYISFLPMTMRGGIFPVTLAGHPQDPASPHVASIRYVTPGFFATLGIPIHRGRDVSDRDTAGAPWVAVVSESFAAQNWPGESALGRRFDIAFGEREVVGIVGDIAVRGLARISEPQVYMPASQMEDATLVWFAPKDLAVRTSIDPSALQAAVQRIVREADPDQPISDMRTLDAIVDTDTAPRTVQVRVLGGFAVLACLLAGLGIHGLLTFSVSARVREIGLRIALGAHARDILTLVIARSALLSGVGLALGVAGALLAGQSLRALLYGVSPADAWTFAAAAAVTLTMTMAGSLVPAIRAVRVDPLEAIRHE